MTKRDLWNLPKYMAEFSCIGPDCEASCCRYPWKVSVDHDTHQLIEALPDSDLKQTVMDALVPDTEHAGEPFRIRFSPSGCPVQDGVGLCRLQKEVGAEYLPRTCAVYPRQFLRVHKRQEVHGALSCPEVGRRVLLDPDALAPTDAISGEALLGRYDARPVDIRIESRNASRYVECLKRVDSFVTDTMTDRGRPVWQRVFTVGLLMELFARKDVARPDAVAESLVAALGEAWRAGGLDDTFATLNRDPATQLVTLLDVLGRRIKAQAGSPITTLVARMVRALDIDYKDPVAAVPAYEAAFREVFVPVMRKNPHVAENYILVHSRAKAVPLRLAGGWKPFLRVSLLYSLFRLLGIGVAAERGASFSVHDLVEVAMMLGRAVEQDTKFVDSIIDRFEERDRLSMGYLGVLFADPPDVSMA